MFSRRFDAQMGAHVRALVVLVVIAFFAVVGSAWAEASTHCVKATKTATKPKHYTGGYTDKNCTAPSATHEGKYEYIKASSLSEPEQEELRALLKYVKVVPSGVASKPTIQVSGANLQVVSGSGSTGGAVNGAGNIVIGYDDEPSGPQTGSNNLILGVGQGFTSYGDILGGSGNTAPGPFSFVVGFKNSASGSDSSVSGGGFNKATAKEASVSGGSENKASGSSASVSAGEKNTASGERASVSGGIENIASGTWSSVSGGERNTAAANGSSIFGGKENKTTKENEAIP